MLVGLSKDSYQVGHKNFNSGGARLQATFHPPVAARIQTPLDSTTVGGAQTPAETLLDKAAGHSLGLETETHLTPGGQTVVDQKLHGPDFSGSYQAGENGRNYSSELTQHTPADGYGQPTELVEHENLVIQERPGPQGEAAQEYHKREERYFADNPQVKGVRTETSGSDTVDTVHVRHDGRESAYSEPLPKDHKAPELAPGSPFRNEVSNTVLPDGSLQRTEVVSDEVTGYMARETVTVDPHGEGAVRVNEKAMPATVVTDDLDGLGILGAFGHDSAQVLFDKHLGEGPVTQRTGTSTTEKLDAGGNVISTATADITSWTNGDGSRTLTMIERGEGAPPEYQLTVRNGDDVSVQKFIGGTEDTEIIREFTDQNGFRNVIIDTQTPEAADKALDAGAKAAVERSVNSSRVKEEASVDDLKGLLGPGYDQLAENNPKFRELLKGLQDQPFGLLDVQSKTALVHPDGSAGEETHRAIGINTPDGVRTLTLDQDSGSWNLSESSEKSGPKALVEETQGAVQASLEKSPALSFNLLRPFSYGSSLSAPLKALELTTLANLAKGVGVAGNLMVAAHGAYELASGNPRGVFDLLSGGGSALGLLGVVSGPVAFGAAAVGWGGQLVYDYVDRTDMAEVQI